MTWSIKFFNELEPAELYKIIRLRIEVFIIEQNCIFQDLDEKDTKCYHLMAWDQDKLAAYTRLVPPGISYETASIGRVVTDSHYRKSGLGRDLMKRSISAVFDIWGEQDITIGAQKYLTTFYTSLGFVQVGDIYLEDDIEHIKMIRSYVSV